MANNPTMAGTRGKPVFEVSDAAGEPDAARDRVQAMKGKRHAECSRRQVGEYRSGRCDGDGRETDDREPEVLRRPEGERQRGKHRQQDRKQHESEHRARRGGDRTRRDDLVGPSLFGQGMAIEQRRGVGRGAGRIE
jgi:hypothetical protein